MVLEEWRLGLGANERVADKELQAELKGSRYADRLPIGKTEIIQHGSPDRVQQFYRDWYRPDLMAVVVVGDFEPSAVEEMIRWTTPVKEFMRTAQQDCDIRGVPISAGQSVLLSYVSGNRDEDVFSDPFLFDVSRDPNKHIAFGYGVHFCLGAALARMEARSFFTELLPRLVSAELAGEPQHIGAAHGAWFGRLWRPVLLAHSSISPS